MDLVKYLILLLLSAASANEFESEKDPIINYSSLENPFRSQKVNLLWNKARTKLTDRKLKQLHTELKVHDKEAMALKKLKADGMDNEGLREAEIRKKFNGIMNSFGLAKIESPLHEQGASKEAHLVFKDKKLQRLWQKAYKAGLEEDELHLLKKEFQHHQDKLDQYRTLKEMQAQSQDANLLSNHINLLNTDDESFDANTLDGKAKALKENYDRLHRLATNSYDLTSTEFKEPKVRGLWKLAQEADFNDEELESLRQELQHYEKRLEKLHHLKAEIDLENVNNNHSFRGKDKMDKKLAKHVDTVDKVHAELASRIAARHSEL